MIAMRKLPQRLGILEGILLSLLFATTMESWPESDEWSGDDKKAVTDLYFGVFISQESAFDFSGFRPPLELGVGTINNHSTTLKGLNERDYFIKYVISNGKVSLNFQQSAPACRTEP